MRLNSLMIVAVVLIVVSSAAVFTAARFDGTDPPHAVDISGVALPDSGTAQPAKPLILSKDSKDPRWGELKPDMAFDHTKHNTDPKHTRDGKTPAQCVYCHHTEQPMPVSGHPYLKKSERNEVLTVAQLESSKQAVNSCRHCHFQPATTATAEYPPKSVKYPREMGLPPSGTLTNDNAYHIKCISCHEAAVKRDATLKPPQACADCHVKKT
jgi:hypothetical protein